MLRRVTAGLAAGLLLASPIASAAVVSGSFSIDSSIIVDLFSATFDGALNPDCTGAADPAECDFVGGQTPATREITFAAQDASTGSGTLDVMYDDATGAITEITSLQVNLPAQELTVDGKNAQPNPLGIAVVTIIPGNSAPVANDTLFVRSGAAASSPADLNEALGQGPEVFENSPSIPNHPDFSDFPNVVDSCTGDATICLLATSGLLALEGIRYRILGTVNAGGGDTFELTAQTSNNSIYKVGFSTAVVPVPAAVWLFGSALGLLGWMRRRSA